MRWPAMENEPTRRANSRCMPRNTYLAVPFRRSRSSSRASGACSPGPLVCPRNLLFRVTAAATDPPQSRVPSAVMSTVRAREREKSTPAETEESRHISARVPSSLRPCVNLGQSSSWPEITLANLRLGEAQTGVFQKEASWSTCKNRGINKSKFQDLFQVECDDK